MALGELPIVGIFAGGQGLRMGGRDKTRLLAPDTGEALLARLVRLARERQLDCVTVGGAPFENLPQLLDAPAGIGPIGGLCALLEHAGERPAIALACDLPYLSAELLARLAREPSAAPVLAARDPATRKWQPLFARYQAHEVLPKLRHAVGRGVRSFQTFLRELDVQELALDDFERAQLRDWDAPGDLE